MDEQSLRWCLNQLGIKVLQKSNNTLISSCPFSPFFHKQGQDRHPSFTAKIDAENFSVYNCFTCHMSGRISSLARALGHHRFGDQWHYQSIIDASNNDRPILNFEELPQQRDTPQEPLVEETFDNMYFSALEYQEAKDYLHSRGISDETTQKLGLLFDEEQRRILFPILGVSGLLYGYSGRSIVDNITPKVRDYAGLRKRQHILGADRWDFKSRKPLIVVEGLFAFAHLVELNVEKVANVGALLGSYLTDWKRELIIKRNTDTFLLVDNDEAGDICLFGKKTMLGDVDTKSGALYKLKNQGFYVSAPEYFGDVDNINKRTIWNILQKKARERYDNRRN